MLTSKRSDSFASPGQMNLDIEGYTKDFSELWHECDLFMPAFDSIYSKEEKASGQEQLKRFYKAFRRKRKKSLYFKNELSGKKSKLVSAIKLFLKKQLKFSDEQLNILFSEGFIEATRDFIEKARSFDSTLCSNDLFQACRNLWTMNWIQLLLGIKIEVTDSVFAYSMLYPYTDNYIDDPAITNDNKKDFNCRLYERLRGKLIQPLDKLEEKIYRLIGMIESQYDRSVYPLVFDSLLAIHSAQIKSLRLSDPETSLPLNDILKISIEKGGTSVLADGFLVSGNPGESARKFLFGYGAYLQLADDLQDIKEDSTAGFNTIFLKAADYAPLDALVNQTFNFGSKIMSCYDSAAENNSEHINDLMRKSNKYLLIEAVGQADNFYSPSFIHKIESFSPVHFTFLKKYQSRLLSLGLLLLE